MKKLILLIPMFCVITLLLVWILFTTSYIGVNNECTYEGKKYNVGDPYPTLSEEERFSIVQCKCRVLEAGHWGWMCGDNPLTLEEFFYSQIYLF